MTQIYKAYSDWCRNALHNCSTKDSSQLLDASICTSYCRSDGRSQNSLGLKVIAHSYSIIKYRIAPVPASVTDMSVLKISGVGNVTSELISFATAFKENLAFPVAVAASYIKAEEASEPPTRNPPRTLVIVRPDRAFPLAATLSNSIDNLLIN